MLSPQSDRTAQSPQGQTSSPSSAGGGGKKSIKDDLRGMDYASGAAALAPPGGPGDQKVAAAPGDGKGPVAPGTGKNDKLMQSTGGGKEYKDGEWADAEHQKKKTTSKKHESKTDLTPEFVTKFNSEIEAKCTKTKTAIIDFLKTNLGSFAPNKVELGLEIAVNGSKGEIEASKEKEAAAPGAGGTSAPQIGASLEGKFAIGWEGLWKIMDWPFGGNVMGEELNGKVALGASIFAGAEAKASLELSVASEALSFAERVLTGWQGLAKKSKDQAKEDATALGSKVDTSQGIPKMQGKSSNERAKTQVGVEGSIDGFVGVKVGAALDASVGWNKKGGAQYSKALGDFVRTSGYVPPELQAPVEFLFDNSSGVADLLMGGAGQVDFASFKGRASVGAGAGASGKLAVTWSSTRGLTFTVQGEAYYGLGAGLSTEVTVNPIDGVRLAIVGAAKSPGLIQELATYAYDEIVKFFDQVKGNIGKFVDWLEADDKVRAAVSQQVHKLATTNQRIEMVKTLLDPACFDASEQAIIDILDFSQKKGDLKDVLAKVPIADLLSKCNGAESSMVRNFLEPDGKKPGKSPGYNVTYDMFPRATKAVVEEDQVWVQSMSMAEFDAHAMYTTKQEWSSQDWWFTVVAPSTATSAWLDNNTLEARYTTHEDARADIATAKGGTIEAAKK